MGHADYMREMEMELREEMASHRVRPVVTISEHEILGWSPIIGEQLCAPELPKQVGGDHYAKLAIQPVDYILGNNLGYLEGNVIKYVTRHLTKGGMQDIDKAIHYLEMIKGKHYNES